MPCLVVILILLAWPSGALAQTPGAQELRAIVERVSQNEKRFSEARGNYTYRQTFQFREAGGGGYDAVTDITFTPDGKRMEVPIKNPVDTLKKIHLTPEDFRDLAEVQPFVLDPEDLWNYEVVYVAEQDLKGVRTHLLKVRPKQTFDGQRLFAGMLWVTQDTFQVIQAEGKAVPDLVKKGRENLFPHFTTIREKIDGQHWFPVLTYASDTLPFKTGPVQMTFTIRYENYKRFGTDIQIKFEKDEGSRPH